MKLYHVYVRTRTGWRDLGVALDTRADAAALARDYARTMRTTAQLRVTTPRSAERHAFFGAVQVASIDRDPMF